MAVFLRYFVGGRGLAPPCLTALPPKGSVSSISPPAHIFLFNVVMSIFLVVILIHTSTEKAKQAAFSVLVRPVGVGPTTVRLRGDCSTS